jgi:uncharacterized protein (DUF2384 family)
MVPTDPTVLASAIVELEEIAARIVRESGRPGTIERFDAQTWVGQWLHEPHPALGGQRPIDRLGTDDGIELVRKLLWRQQTGAYS